MTLRNTVDVAWREARDAWVVEGGDGATAVLGVCSLHDSKSAAVESAERLATEHDAEVRVLDDGSDGWL